MSFYKLFKEGSIFNKIDVWYYAQVISVDDPFDAHRIKVRIPGIDNVYKDNSEILENDSLWVVPFYLKL
jgi:hypothetical protein